MTDLTKELDMVREKWTKSREEAAKTEEEMIMAKALLKQKEAELNQAMEVRMFFQGQRYTARSHSRKFQGLFSGFWSCQVFANSIMIIFPRAAPVPPRAREGACNFFFFSFQAELGH